MNIFNKNDLHNTINFSDVKTIDLKEADTIELNLITKCKNLIVLKIDNCIASKFLYGVSTNCKKLEYLYLKKVYDNIITHNMSIEIKNLKYLRYLSLVNFNFADLPKELSYLNKLEYLRIFTCGRHDINIDVIYDIKSLKYLLLSDVWWIDDEIIKLQNLMHLYIDVPECRLSKNVYKLPQLYKLNVTYSLYDEDNFLENEFHECNKDKITIFDSKSINSLTNFDIHSLIKGYEMCILSNEYNEKWSPSIPNNIKKLRILSGNGDNCCKKEYLDLSNLPNTLEYIEFHFNLDNSSQYNLNNIPFSVNTIQINIGNLLDNTKNKYYNYKNMSTIAHPKIDLINGTKKELEKYIANLKIPFGCKIIINDMNTFTKYEYII